MMPPASAAVEILQTLRSLCQISSKLMSDILFFFYFFDYKKYELIMNWGSTMCQKLINIINEIQRWKYIYLYVPLCWRYAQYNWVKFIWDTLCSHILRSAQVVFLGPVSPFSGKPPPQSAVRCVHALGMQGTLGMQGREDRQVQGSAMMQVSTGR